MTHVVLEYLGECAPDITSFRHLLSDLSLSTDQLFACRAKLVHDGCQEKNPCSQREFERLIGTMITGPSSSSTRLKRTGRSFHRTGVILAEDRSGSIAGHTTSATRANASSFIPGS